MSAWLLRALCGSEWIQSLFFAKERNIIRRFIDATDISVSQKTHIQDNLFLNIWSAFKPISNCLAYQNPEDMNSMVQLSGLEHLQNAMSAENGAICVSYHSATDAPFLTALTEAIAQRPMIVGNAGKMLVKKGISKTRENKLLGFTRQLFTAQQQLKAGGIVWIDGDGFQGEKGLHRTFFHRHRLFRTGFSELAAVTHATVIPSVHGYLPDGRFRLTFLAPIVVPLGLDHSQAEAFRLERYLTSLSEIWQQMPKTLRWGQMHKHFMEPSAQDDLHPFKLNQANHQQTSIRTVHHAVTVGERLLEEVFYRFCDRISYEQGRQILKYIANQPVLRRYLFPQQIKLVQRFVKELVLSTEDTLDETSIISTSLFYNPARIWWKYVMDDPVVVQRWVSVSGREHLDQAIAKGGVILLKSHLAPGAIFTIWLRHSVYASRFFPVVKMADMTAEKCQSRSSENIKQLLHYGKIVVLNGDGPEKNSDFSFLGKERRFATQYAKIAAETARPILPFFEFPQPDGTIQVHIHSPLTAKGGTLSEQATGYINQYLTLLERVWCKHPELVRWKQIRRFFSEGKLNA